MKKFTIEHDELLSNLFLTFPDKFPQLKYVYINNNWAVNKTQADSIEKFIERSKHLISVSMNIKMEKTERDIIEKNLKKNKWHVEITEEDGSIDKIHLNVR